MKKIFKWISGVIIILLLIPVTISFYLNKEDYKSLIESQFYSQTGRELVIAGNLEFQSGLIPSVVIDDIRLTNAQWATEPWAAKIAKATLSLSVDNLLRGELVINNIVLDQPELWIERGIDGNFNLDIFDASSEGESILPEWLAIEEAAIHEGNIYYEQSRNPLYFSSINGRFSAEARNAPIVFDVEMFFQETLIKGKGEIPDLITLFNHKVGNVTVSGVLDSHKNSFTAIGSIEDLLSWEGLNLNVDAKIRDLKGLSKLVNIDLPDIGIIETTLKFQQPGQSDSASVKEIALHFSQWGIPIIVTGEIEELYKMKGIDLSLSSNSILDLSFFSHIDNDHKQLEVKAEANYSGSLQSNVLKIHHASATGFNSQLSVIGEAKNIHQDWQGISFHLNMMEPKIIGQAFNIKLPQWNAVSGSAELMKERDVISLQNINIKTDGSDPYIEATGSVSDLKDFQSARFETTLSSNDLSFIPLEFSPWLERVNKINAVSDLIIEDNKVRANISQASFYFDQSPFSVNGRVDDLFSFVGVDIAFLGQMENFQETLSLKNKFLEDLQPISLSARLVDDTAGLHLKQLTASLDQLPENNNLSEITFKAEGEINQLGQNLQSNIHFNATIESPNKSLLSNNDKWPHVEIIKASGDVLSTSIEDWVVSNIKASANQDEGSIVLSQGSFAVKENLFDGKINVIDFPIFLSEWNHVFASLPMSSLSGQAKLFMDSKYRVSLNEIDGVLRSPLSDVTVSGDIGSFFPMSQINLNVDIVAENLLEIPLLSPQTFEPVTPVTTNINLTSHELGFQADIAARVGGSDLEGRISWNSLDDQTVFSGDIHSEILDLREILVKSKEDQRLFSKTTLNTNWIKSLDGSLTLTANNYRDHFLTAEQLSIHSRFENSTMLQRSTAILGKGKLTHTLELNHKHYVPSYTLTTYGEQLDISRFSLFDDPNFLSSGTANVDLAIKGEGTSISEVAATSTGSFVFELENSHIQDKSLNRFGGDVFLNLLNVINPFNESNKGFDIECSVFNFDIRDGLAISQKGIAILTPKVSILGGGDIDLDEETLQLLIKPKARKGLGISATTIANLVQITGPVSNPEITPVTKSILQSGAKIGAVVATGGWTLLAQGLLASGLFSKNKANAGVCDIARKETEALE